MGIHSRANNILDRRFMAKKEKVKRYLGLIESNVIKTRKKV